LQKSMIKLLSIADLISITNAILGILSIIFLFSNLIDSQDLRFRVSFSFILIAILADGLDGMAARKIGKSEIGEYLEAMADMTSLIIAPAIFIYFIYSDTTACCLYKNIYLLFALILFLSFGIIRLASFHILKNDKFFVGFPAPASTILLLILSYFKIDFLFILPTVIIIGAAMVSNIKFPKPGLKTNSIAALLIILTLFIDKSYYGIAPILLFIAVVTYTIGGAIYIKFLVKK
jgi:CDP-diacylglycerol--serine O-phosphatidyltransferase